MPDLFGLDIASLVAGAISAAGGLRSVVLVKKTPGVRNPVNLTGGTNPATATHICEGVVTDYDTRAIDGTRIKTGDRQVMILGATLPAGVEPADGDQAVIDGVTYNLGPSVTSDPAKAQFTAQARKVP